MMTFKFFIYANNNIKTTPTINNNNTSTSTTMIRRPFTSSFPLYTTTSITSLLIVVVVLLLVVLPQRTQSFVPTIILKQQHYYQQPQQNKNKDYTKLHSLQPDDIITNNNNNNNDSSSTTSFFSNEPQPNLIPNETILKKLSKLEQEFYSMMKEFTFYTPKDISTIPNPSYRALYKGVYAGSTEPDVMNAFAIIFNDLLPIRIAGRMIYNHLKTIMDDNIYKRIEEEKRVQNETGLSMDAIDDGRRTFMAILSSSTSSSSANEEGYLTMTELIDTGIIEMIVELMEYESFDDFVSRMEEEESEKINFEKFMYGLQKCALMKNEKVDDDGNTFCDVSCDLEEVLSVTAQRMAPIEAEKKGMTVSERKKKYSDRYDEMVKSFEEWETLVPTGDGRMIQVLNGCFAGAKNQDIVNALKIVYMDYSALRVGGDLVFKLMGKLVERRKKKQ